MIIWILKLYRNKVDFCTWMMGIGNEDNRENVKDGDDNGDDPND